MDRPDRSSDRPRDRSLDRSREAATRRRVVRVGRARLRLPELALGVGLVAAGALAAVLWATHEPSQRVLVAARAIHRGESLSPEMVRWASVSGDHLTAVTNPSGLGGRLAAVDIAPGSPLLVSLFRAPVAVGVGQTEYGLALGPGDYPVGLAVGDHVVVVVVPPVGADGRPVAPEVLDGTAQVLVAPDPAVAPGATAVVNLLVADADVPVMAAAADVRVGRVSEPAAGA
jgi:hypothetical protein